VKVLSILFASGVLAVAAVAALPATAAQRCSVHPAKGLSDAQLLSLAKLSRTEAEKIALASLKSTAAVSVSSAELEAEHGCLIWSFDLKVVGKSGVQEVQVDAGDGKVLSAKHETSQKESAEAAKEAAETSKQPESAPPK
jgi:hypothetical protein